MAHRTHRRPFGRIHLTLRVRVSYLRRPRQRLTHRWYRRRRPPRAARRASGVSPPRRSPRAGAWAAGSRRTAASAPPASDSRRCPQVTKNIIIWKYKENYMTWEIWKRRKFWKRVMRPLGDREKADPVYNVQKKDLLKLPSPWWKYPLENGQWI